MSLLCLKELLKESICPGLLPVFFYFLLPFEYHRSYFWLTGMVICSSHSHVVSLDRREIMNLAFLHYLGPQGNNCSHRYRAEKMSELGFSTILYLHFSWFLFFQYCLCIYVQLAAQQGSKSLLSLEEYLITARKGYNSSDKKTRQQPNFWNLQHCLELLKL